MNGRNTLKNLVHHLCGLGKVASCGEKVKRFTLASVPQASNNSKTFSRAVWILFDSPLLVTLFAISETHSTVCYKGEELLYISEI